MARLPSPSLALETEGFVMRPLVEADACESIAAWTADSLTAEMLNAPQRGWDVKSQAAYFAGVAAQTGKVLLGIWPRREGHPIGLYLLQCQPAFGTFHISHLIGDPDWRGKDVSDETAEAIYEYFFDELGYAKAKANVRPENRAVLWVMCRRGLWKKEARLAGHLLNPNTGRREDLLVLGLLAEEWRALRNELPGLARAP
jgi:RimJ/RimL family protein N-acetyltransferase